MTAGVVGPAAPSGQPPGDPALPCETWDLVSVHTASSLSPEKVAFSSDCDCGVCQTQEGVEAGTAATPVPPQTPPEPAGPSRRQPAVPRAFTPAQPVCVVGFLLPSDEVHGQGCRIGWLSGGLCCFVFVCFLLWPYLHFVFCAPGQTASL